MFNKMRIHGKNYFIITFKKSLNSHNISRHLVSECVSMSVSVSVLLIGLINS